MRTFLDKIKSSLDIANGDPESNLIEGGINLYNASSTTIHASLLTSKQKEIFFIHNVKWDNGKWKEVQKAQEVRWKAQLEGLYFFTIHIEPRKFDLQIKKNLRQEVLIIVEPSNQLKVENAVDWKLLNRGIYIINLTDNIIQFIIERGNDTTGWQCLKSNDPDDDQQERWRAQVGLFRVFFKVNGQQFGINVNRAGLVDKIVIQVNGYNALDIQNDDTVTWAPRRYHVSSFGQEIIQSKNEPLEEQKQSSELPELTNNQLNKNEQTFIEKIVKSGIKIINLTSKKIQVQIQKEGPFDTDFFLKISKNGQRDWSRGEGIFLIQIKLKEQLFSIFVKKQPENKTNVFIQGYKQILVHNVEKWSFKEIQEDNNQFFKNDLDLVFENKTQDQVEFELQNLNSKQKIVFILLKNEEKKMGSSKCEYLLKYKINEEQFYEVLVNTYAEELSKIIINGFKDIEIKGESYLRNMQQIQKQLIKRVQTSQSKDMLLELIPTEFQKQQSERIEISQPMQNKNFLSSKKTEVLDNKQQSDQSIDGMKNQFIMNE